MMSARDSSSPRETAEIARKYGFAAITLVLNKLFFIYILSYIFSAVISLFPNAAELTDKSTDAGYLIYLIFNEVCSYALPIAVYIFLFRKEPEESATPAGYKRFIGETPLLYFAGWFFATVGAHITYYVSTFLGAVFAVPKAQTAFSSSMPQSAFMFTAFAVCTCVIAPVCEEIIYRRLLLDPMKKYSDSAAAFVTSLLFALSHFNFDQFLYTFAFGYFLAVIAIRSRSVIPCIICHIINNLTAGINNYLPETFGNETADKVFHGISSALDAASPFILIISVPVAAVTLILRLHKLQDHGGMPLTKRLAEIFRDPVLLVTIIVMLVITFIKLYN